MSFSLEHKTEIIIKKRQINIFIWRGGRYRNEENMNIFPTNEKKIIWKMDGWTEQMDRHNSNEKKITLKNYKCFELN